MVSTRKDASKRMEQGQRKERAGCSGEKLDGRDRGARRTPPPAARPALHSLGGFEEGSANLLSGFVGLGPSGNITADIELS